jgi:signal transduction histidine kinase
MKTNTAVSEGPQFVLSNLSPGLAQKRFALAVVLGSLAIFVMISFGPLGGVRLRRVDAFTPAYVTAMFICQAITAILLYAQFSILRSRAILVIASGYLFSALMLIPFALVFPGVFAPGPGLLGGVQSTSWLWCFGHVGFPLFTIGYALLKKDTNSSGGFWRGTMRAQISLSVALTAAIVCVAALFFIVGEAILPRVAFDYGHFTDLWPYLIGAPVAFANVSAFIILWGRRHSMLDLWLIVVIFLNLIEVVLSYYPHPIRFSVGSYAVRTIGFLASGLVLSVLLYEITTLYGSLLDVLLRQRREREARRMTGDTIIAAIAHEVKQPLTAMITSADAGFRFLDRATPNLDKAKGAFKRIVADGHRAEAIVESIRSNFKIDDRTKTPLNVNELIRGAIAMERADLQKHRILVQAVPNAGLPEVRGNQVQLQQVLLNLITNAIDAMASKNEPRVLLVKSEVHEDTGIVVSVADTGAGINPQDIDRIFNPLYTTKSDGMGMGLSICRAIVEAHHGRLWVTPNAPCGAVFQFTLRANNPVSARA